MAYGLPSSTVLENYLYTQEANLIAGIKTKAKPRSKSIQGFSFLKQDAEWLKRFWRAYMHSDRNGSNPSLLLAFHHYNVLDDFIDLEIQRCQAIKVADTLQAKLASKDFSRPSYEDYKEFASNKPNYRPFRRLREEFSPLTKTNWIAGRR